MFSFTGMWNNSLTADSNTTNQTDTTDLTEFVTSTSTPEVEPELSLGERLLLLSKEQRATAEETLLIIRYVIFAVSLPATVCNVVVFLQPNMQSATSVYVICLSLVQLLYIAIGVLGRILFTSLDSPMTSETYLVYSIYISSYLSLMIRRGSYLVMCWMSLERLYAVLRPFHIKEFIFARFPLFITIISFAVSAIWHVYMLVKTYVDQVRNSRTGQLMNMMLYTDIYKNNPEIADGFGVAAPILLTYIPLSALITLNVLTVWALRRHNTQRLQSSASEQASQHRERQMTVTILATTVIYVILSLPYAFHTLFKSAFEEFDKRQKYQNLYYVMRSCSFTLTLLSCALDFVCFVVLSSNFRKTFLALIGLRSKGSKQSVKESSSGFTTNTKVEDKY